MTDLTSFTPPALGQITDALSTVGKINTQVATLGDPTATTAVGGAVAMMNGSLINYNGMVADQMAAFPANVAMAQQHVAVGMSDCENGMIAKLKRLMNTISSALKDIQGFLQRILDAIAAGAQAVMALINEIIQDIQAAVAAITKFIADQIAALEELVAQMVKDLLNRAVAGLLAALGLDECIQVHF